jgi:RND family efflux transporter MFP subunit
MKPLPIARTLALLTTGSVALGLTACKEAPAAPTPPPPPVTVTNPVMKEITAYAEFPASLKADATVEIRARVSGILKKMHFTEGGTVQKDQLLFEIEEDAYVQALSAAEADKKSADAALKLAEDRLKGIQQAFEKNAVSKIDRDVAVSEVSQAAAAVDQAQAQVDNAQLQLSYTKIKAPISGRISRDIAGVDNLVGTGEATLLTVIVDDSKMGAYFEVPERDVLSYLEARSNEENAKAIKDKPLKLRLSNGTIYGNEAEEAGHIDFIDNRTDSQSRTNQVRAMFPNPDGKLADGLYGLVRIPVGPVPGDPKSMEALILPATALQRDLGGSFVWTVTSEDKVKRTPITLGRKLDPAETNNVSMITVVTGLTEEDRVIIAGTQRAREGATVKPMPAEPTETPAEKPVE